METLSVLLKESLEGRLTDQIRASLTSEDEVEKSDDTNSGESKPEWYKILGTLKYMDAKNNSRGNMQR